MKILIRVKDRWLDNDEYDQYGELIRWANPNPTVVWHSGCWSRETGQGVMMAMTASKFFELTGVMTYGGSIEKPGIHEISILTTAYEALMMFRKHGVSIKGGPKKSTRTLPKVDKLKEAREGRAKQIKGMKCRVRKKSN